MSNTIKSIYDKIETAKGLAFEVMAHGLSTKIEDTCRAQDIFGNSSVEELEALAKDEHRSRVFYQIIFTIWNWEDATRFYNQTSNPLYIEGREAIKKCDVLKMELKRKEESLNAQIGEKAECDMKLREAINKQYELNAELKAKDEEILKLKARLYDLMAVSGK